MNLVSLYALSFVLILMGPLENSNACKSDKVSNRKQRKSQVAPDHLSRKKHQKESTRHKGVKKNDLGVRTSVSKPRHILHVHIYEGLNFVFSR